MATARFTISTLAEDYSGKYSTTISDVNPALLNGDDATDKANAAKINAALTNIIDTLTEEHFSKVDYQVTNSVNDYIAD